MMKKFGRPNYPMGQLKMLEDAVWEERRRNPAPSPAKCDGCLSRFRGTPIEEDDDFGTPDEDVGEVFKRCRECDYTICEDCSKPENQGEFLHITFFSFFLLVLTIYCQESYFLISQRALVAARPQISVLAIAFRGRAT